MKLLRQIQESAADSKTDLGDVLRQCRILASRILDTEFETWVDQELSGYHKASVLPDYRKLKSNAYGDFVGAFNEQRKNVPLPSAALDEKHRHFAEDILLREPIAIYADLIEKGGSEFVIEWSANLVLYYSDKFYDGDLVLQRAWQSAARSQFVGVVETVRNRILRFALELSKTNPDLGESEQPLQTATKEKVSQIFHTHIHGSVGNIATGSTHVSQVTTMNVQSGDLAALLQAMAQLGVPQSDVSDLEAAVRTDNTGNRTEGVIGANASSWLGRMMEKAASGVWQLSLSTAGVMLPKILGMYFGVTF